MLQKKVHTYLQFIFLLLTIVLAGIILFRNLGTLPIRLYDESRLAINTWHMVHDGDFIVTKFEGEPDMWNTKPPLFIWLQVASVKLFGMNEFALRLPSALASLFTCIIIFFMCRKYFQVMWAGIGAVLYLLTAEGFTGIHTARFGEYDALLTLFLTIHALFYFLFLEHPDKKMLFYISVLALGMGVLTKSIAAMLFIPGLFIYTLQQKKMSIVLRSKHTYIGILLFLLLTAGYYLLREYYNPGYLQAVWENDIGGRYVSSEKMSTTFYWEIMVQERFSLLYLLPIAGIAAGIASKKAVVKRMTILSTLIVFSYLFIITSGDVKHEWYTMPVYPFLALLSGILFYAIQEFVKRKKNIFITGCMLAAAIYIFYDPVLVKIQDVIAVKERSWEKGYYEISAFLKKSVENNNTNLQNYTIMCTGYCAHQLYYILLLREKNIFINWITPGEFSGQQKIIIQDEELFAGIQKRYNVRVDSVLGNIKFVTILNAPE